MKQLVSKVRAKKTKSREKQATRPAAKVPISKHPCIGLLYAFLLWLSAVLLLGMDMVVHSPTDPREFLVLAGHAMLLLASLFACGLFLKITKPTILPQNPKILLICVVSLLSLCAVKAVIYLTSTIDLFPPDIILFFLPLATAALLTTILLGSTAGLAVGIWTGLATAMMFNDSFPLFIIAMIVTVITAYLAPNIRTRSKVIRIGIIIGLCKTACLSGFTALNWDSDTMNVTLVLHQAAACLVSEFLAAAIVLLFLPAFETLFRITTDMVLFELSDLGHPILQRLAIEAPGTYHHSLIVANLAQAAADEIGANSLLARICSYFHDIGKLTKPEFFAENIQLQNNPHDDLPPSMSTLVITAHVKEGLSLAVLHKLPAPVMNVIREHHGTSLLSYFHHKAKSQLEFELGSQEDTQGNGNSTLDENDFRYPGPRPSTRESGIICLADAVEATSRTLKKATPGNIESMVNDIVNTRLKDGQLDDCTMTLEELTRVKRSFMFTLSNMLHGRVPYPENENRDKQQPNASPNEQPEHKDTDTTSSAPGHTP